MKGITITNQKGGVAKSTTTVNLACALAEQHRSVLAIDMDPQTTMTRLFGMVPEQLEQATIGEVLVGSATLDEATVQVSEEVSVVPARPELQGVMRELANMVRREERLATALSSVRPYDYVLIDTAPNLLELTVNAIVATRSVIIPVATSDAESVEGAIKTLEGINLLNAAGIEVELFGLLATRTFPKRDAHRAIADALPGLGRVLDTQIPEYAEAQKAAFHKTPLFWLNPDCSVSEAYRKLASEIIGREESFHVGALAAGAATSESQMAGAKNA